MPSEIPTPVGRDLHCAFYFLLSTFCFVPACWSLVAGNWSLSLCLFRGSDRRLSRPGRDVRHNRPPKQNPPNSPFSSLGGRSFSSDINPPTKKYPPNFSSPGDFNRPGLLFPTTRQSPLVSRHCSLITLFLNSHCEVLESKLRQVDWQQERKVVFGS